MAKTATQATESPKRKKVTVTPIVRDDQGGPECYAILDRLVAADRSDLVMVKIALAFKRGWKPDKDGRLKAGQCCRPNEVSRQLMDYDIVILLNEELWPHFEPIEREELIYHELQHVAVVLDETTGEAKLDERNRIVVRIRHHDIEEFQVVRERYGHDNLGAAARRIWAQLQEPLLHQGKTTTKSGKARAA